MTTPRPGPRPPVHRFRREGRAIAYRSYPAVGAPDTGRDTQTGAPLPVVLIHGFGGDMLSWGTTPALLAARGHETHVFDLPGHGRSGLDIGDGSLGMFVEAVRDLLEETGVGRAALVGHSLGGLIAMQAALEVGVGVGGVGLLAPAGVNPRPSTAFLDAFVAADSRDALAAVMTRLVADPTLVPRAVVDHIWAWKRRERVEDNLARILRTAFVDESGLRLPGAALAEAGVPTALVWGEQDAVIPLPALQDFPPHAVVSVLPGVGHSPHLEAPEATLDALAPALTG